MRALFCMAVAVFVALVPAQAEEDEGFELDVDIAETVICDTPAQVERFISLFDGDVERALDTVNDEQEVEPACDAATIAYLPHEDVSKAHGPAGNFRVVRITLIGMLADDGFRYAVPALYFIALPDKDRFEVRAR